jgi:CPA1 family monovalent cation:H+ antiporter
VRLRQRLDDPVLNTTISFAVPFLAYFPTEEADASGVLAVVLAGLVTGAMGSRRFSARDRQTQATTWTTINFVLESGLFLAMGYQLSEFVDAARDETTTGEITALAAIVVGLLVALRFLALAWPAIRSVTGRGQRGDDLHERLDQFEQKLDAMAPAGAREERRLAWARRRLARVRADAHFEAREPITARGSLVLAWAGMRGVVTVAAVQSIPVGTPHRATVILVAFFVALVTLLLFGLTLPTLIARMAFSPESTEDKRDAFQALLRQVGESALDALGPLEEQTIDGVPVDPQLVTTMKEQVLPRILAGARRANEAAPSALEQSLIIQRRYLSAMRDALGSERSIGAYSSATYRRVESLLDSYEQRITSS